MAGSADLIRPLVTRATMDLPLGRSLQVRVGPGTPTTPVDAGVTTWRLGRL